METYNPQRKAYTKYDGELDYCRAVVEWEIARGTRNNKFNIDEVIPGSSEAKAMRGYLAQYTKFNNMLRYCKGVVPHYLEHHWDKTISWNPFEEHTPTPIKNRTAELYAERRFDKLMSDPELIVN